MRFYMLSIFLILQLAIPFNSFAEGGFFNGGSRYRGWYWFEEAEKPAKPKKSKKIIPSISPKEAELDIERRKADLEAARNVMIATAYRKAATKEELYEAARAYKQKEDEMFKGGMKLADAWAMVNFLHPELLDNLNVPSSAHANKVKRKMLKEKSFQDISNFAKDFDLVIFMSESCPYCKAFEPILQGFATKYGFNVEALSTSGTASKIFPNKHESGLIKKLGITAAPTLVAVKKDGKDAFELARGMMTLDELEGNAELAVQYLEEKRREE